MLSDVRLINIQYCIEYVINNNIAGDIVEAGCWKGGSAIFAKACLKAYAANDKQQRLLWCADKFEDMRSYYSTPLIVFGQPFFKLFAKAAKLMSYSFKNKLMNICNRGFPNDIYDKKTVDLYFSNFAHTSWLSSIRHKHFLMQKGLEDVKEAFNRYDLLDDKINFLSGWFDETLPKAATEINNIAVLRADGDFYKSTNDILVNLYTKLSQGGFCIVDDYGAFSECKRAVDEYRQAQNISEPIQWIDDEAIFWQKESNH